MDPYENPSADKFGPPPDQELEDQRRVIADKRHWLKGVAALVGLAGISLGRYVRSKWGVIGGLVAALVGIVGYAIDRFYSERLDAESEHRSITR